MLLTLRRPASILAYLGGKGAWLLACSYSLSRLWLVLYSVIYSLLRQIWECRRIHKRAFCLSAFSYFFGTFYSKSSFSLPAPPRAACTCQSRSDPLSFASCHCLRGSVLFCWILTSSHNLYTYLIIVASVSFVMPAWAAGSEVHILSSSPSVFALPATASSASVTE